MGLQSEWGQLQQQRAGDAKQCGTSGKTSLPTPLAAASHRLRARRESPIAVVGLFQTRGSSGRETLGPCREAKLGSASIAGGSVSTSRFQGSRSRLRRMRFSMGFQSDFCCPTASRLAEGGEALKRGYFYERFGSCNAIAGVSKRSDGRGARPQDLRFSFAVHRISQCIRRAEDLNRLLPALSTYMGYSSLTKSEQFLAYAPDRFREDLRKLSPAREGHGVGGITSVSWMTFGISSGSVNLRGLSTQVGDKLTTRPCSPFLNE